MRIAGERIGLPFSPERYTAGPRCAASSILAHAMGGDCAGASLSKLDHNDAFAHRQHMCSARALPPVDGALSSLSGGAGGMLRA